MIVAVDFSRPFCGLSLVRILWAGHPGVPRALVSGFRPLTLTPCGCTQLPVSALRLNEQHDVTVKKLVERKIVPADFRSE